jgi:hypothetical protein
MTKSGERAKLAPFVTEPKLFMRGGECYGKKVTRKSTDVCAKALKKGVDFVENKKGVLRTG